MYTIFSFLACAALACLVISLWKPWFCPLKNSGRVKAVFFYLAVFIVFYALSGLVAPDKSQQVARVAAVPEEAQQTVAADKGMSVEVLAKETVAMPATGRNRLQVTLSMYEKQEKATQQELAHIASREAVKYQEETGVPVVMVTLVCQKADNALGEVPLAQVVYIPDGKGFDGVSATDSPWETLRAAKRGFSLSELKYLQLWAKQYRNFQSPSGVQEKELDAAVSAELGIAPGSVLPFANTLDVVVMAANK